MSAARGRVLIATLGLVWVGALMAQPVYKWVDAQGQTHYGSQLPPQQADASQVKVSPNGSSGAGAGRFGEGAEARNPDGTRKLPKGAQEMADGLAQGLRKVDGKEVALNCALAVDNIRSQIETMLENGQKNLRGGYITQAQYDSSAGNFVKLRSQATVSDCKAATGRSRDMYQCMSSMHNHLVGCAEKHRP
ncbi:MULTISPECIES: DUF4124 domain-containing protein [Comamonas]|uniref:DUF4124 domain-containing protein n=1 Tax=Comamonas testosteroni TaxID=285 RepID=A0A096F9I7_COMTE|nr:MULTISPECIES: DUF4124 domain-containing protein [Comamonas]KGH26594.1 hypothetical protein P353_20755 [Comamonas testosteroni]MPT10565.1 DUF4124 domain-containing protein [Comamonas sp.]